MKKIMTWVSVLLCVCLFVSPISVSARSTDQANEQIDTSKKCTLTLAYTAENIAFSDATVELYQIATVSSDFQYTATEEFSACNIRFYGISSQDEWNAIRSTLVSYISSNSDAAPVVSRQTDKEGKVTFDDLEPGLYLTMPVRITQDGFRYYFDSILAALPTLDENDLWLYEVAANCKPDIDNPTGEDIQYRVLKLWKDEGREQNRTESVEIDIIKDGATVKTVVLSDENNWSFSWYALDDGSVWSVTERNVPDGYTMTVENRLTTFTVVNTATPPPPPEIPQTGDTSNIGFYILLMCVSGVALIILTSAMRRNRYE